MAGKIKLNTFIIMSPEAEAIPTTSQYDDRAFPGHAGVAVIHEETSSGEGSWEADQLSDSCDQVYYLAGRGRPGTNTSTNHQLVRHDVTAVTESRRYLYTQLDNAHLLVLDADSPNRGAG